jgi:hypothetical protein
MYQVAAAFLVINGAVSQVTLAQRAPIAQSLDLTVGRPPELTRIGGQTHLVYELHITNFLRTDIVLARIQTLGDQPGATIADVRGTDLEPMLARPGVRGATDIRRIAPGSRVVAYYWMPLPQDTAAPRTVRHRIDMDVQHPTGPVRATFEGAEAVVAADAAVVIGPPLRDSAWAAVYHPQLMGGHRTVFYTFDGKARIPGRYAIDWIRLGPDGTFATDTPAARDRNGYGADVIAVANGVVALAMDDIPDNVGAPAAAAHTLENASGNHVAIDIGGGRFAFYEHLQHGSVVVKAGDRVQRGQVIARLGNSGSSSIGPHLHFHVSDAASALGAEGVPFVISEFEVMGEFPSIAAFRAGERPAAAPAHRAGERREERPAANVVVRFP